MRSNNKIVILDKSHPFGWLLFLWLMSDLGMSDGFEMYDWRIYDFLGYRGSPMYDLLRIGIRVPFTAGVKDQRVRPAFGEVKRC
jgi:hypothetical protein